MSLKKCAGFSLVELAVTLLIAGLIASLLLSYQQYNTTANAISSTQTNMKTIQDAMTVFLAKNGRLPCPASPSQKASNVTFAKEQLVTNSSPNTCKTTNTDIISSNLSGDMIYYGAVPTSSLGLSNDYMFDAWNNRIAYVVQMASINSSITNTSCLNNVSPYNYSIINTNAVNGNAAQDIHSLSYFCFAAQASGSLNFSTIDMEVHQSYLSTSQSLSNDVVYVLISTGPNGYGSYKRSADKDVDGGGILGVNTLRNTTSSNLNERVNSGCSSTGTCSSTSVGNIFVSQVATSGFDDILLYKERNQMIIDCNNNLNNECQTTFGMRIR